MKIPSCYRFIELRMKTLNTFLILSFVFFYSCASKNDTAVLGYGEIISFSKKMHKKNHLDLFGIGGIYQEKTIDIMDVDYNCYEKVDLAVARMQLITGIEGFLNDINQNLKLRPYLRQYPCTHQGVRMAILYSKTEINDETESVFVPPPYIASAFLVNGRLNYSIYDTEKDKLVHVHDETYEEALQIVTNENPDLLQTR